jgi:hypothetical protein
LEDNKLKDLELEALVEVPPVASAVNRNSKLKVLEEVASEEVSSNLKEEQEASLAEEPHQALEVEEVLAVLKPQNQEVYSEAHQLQAVASEPHKEYKVVEASPVALDKLHRALEVNNQAKPDLEVNKPKDLEESVPNHKALLEDYLVEELKQLPALEPELAQFKVLEDNNPQLVVFSVELVALGLSKNQPVEVYSNKIHHLESEVDSAEARWAYSHNSNKVEQNSTPHHHPLNFSQ